MGELKYNKRTKKWEDDNYDETTMYLDMDEIEKDWKEQKRHLKSFWKLW